MDTINQKMAQWQEAMDAMNEFAGEEILGPSPSKDAKWIAEDLCISAGWLYALGGDNLLPSNWRMQLGGPIAMNAGKIVLNSLIEAKEDLGKIIKVAPRQSANETLDHYMARALEIGRGPFGNLLDSTEEEIVFCRLTNWAAGLAIRQSYHSSPLPIGAYHMVGDQLWEADFGAKFLSLLSALEQAEAEVDGALADPIMKIWLQETVAQIKKSPLVEAVIVAGIADLPEIFR